MIGIIIYKFTNKINGKVYIGQTTRDLECRIKQHLSEVRGSRPSAIHKAIKKYSIDNFEIVTIDIATTIEELNLKEIYWINYYGSTSNENGYNMTFGGNNEVPNQEVRLKMSKAKKGKHLPLEHCKNISKATTGENNPNYGKVMTDEQKKKLSIAQTGKYVGEKNPNYGKTHTEEAKKKISESWKGKHHTEESKQKMSNVHKGKRPNWTDEGRKRIYEANKNRVMTEEAKRHLSEINKGKKASDITRQKMSETRKGMIRSEEAKRKTSKANKGRKHSEESIQKMRESHSTISEETRRRLSEASKAIWAKKKEKQNTCG